jgi:hypothetical protein
MLRGGTSQYKRKDLPSSTNHSTQHARNMGLPALFEVSVVSDTGKSGKQEPNQ